ncbi:hypothetical protein H0H92_004157 [Tricholoma furcatifolium]|nr:hypothetical protein H0H92_004157 [Tricholoma furcatifolium]
MTPEERQMLQSFGIALWNNFRLTLGPSLLYGMFVPLVIVTSYDLVKATLCIILLGLISATGYIITILADIIYPVNLTFLANLGIPLEARLAITDAQLQTWTIASTWFQDLPILLNDGIIVWRASAIFARKRWALYLLTALWGITAGARPCVSVLDDFDHLHAGLLVFTISYAIIASVPTPSAMAVTDSSIIFYLYTGFSIGTNFLATSFIAYILRLAESLLKFDEKGTFEAHPKQCGC